MARASRAQLRWCHVALIAVRVILEVATSGSATTVAGQVIYVRIAPYFKYYLGPRHHRQDNQGFSGAKARPELTLFTSKVCSKSDMKLGQV